MADPLNVLASSDVLTLFLHALHDRNEPLYLPCFEWRFVSFVQAYAHDESDGTFHMVSTAPAPHPEYAAEHIELLLEMDPDQPMVMRAHFSYDIGNPYKGGSFYSSDVWVSREVWLGNAQRLDRAFGSGTVWHDKLAEVCPSYNIPSEGEH